MQNSQQIERKSQELAFALIRIAAYIRKIELKKRIDALSFKLIQNIGEERFEESIRTLKALKNLVEIGKHLFQIEPINAGILLREIELINTAIRQSAHDESLPDLEKYFAELNKNSDKTDRSDKTDKSDRIDSEVSEIRQGKIIAKIRQSTGGKLQLRDMIAEFPGVSERTLRYDLKKLSDEGKVTRQGTGGPSNYYMLTDLSTGVINP